jgi:isopenicillin N synthase-like dioxygenase
MPIVDYALIGLGKRDEFLRQLNKALSEVGFLVLENAPGLEDTFQQRAFSEVRRFFDSDAEVKLTADKRNSPHYRGWSRATDLGNAPAADAKGRPRFSQVRDYVTFWSIFLLVRTVSDIFVRLPGYRELFLQF